MHLEQRTSSSYEVREGSLDEFIAHLHANYPRVPPEAWQDFKDQVAAIGKQHGTVTLKYDVDVETNTIKVSIAQPN
jgi:hypothetical protein